MAKRVTSLLYIFYKFVIHFVAYIIIFCFLNNKLQH